MTTVLPERPTSRRNSSGATAGPETAEPTALGAGGGLRAALGAPRRRWQQVSEALDRPLTVYYVLLTAAALLLTIGLIMVLSASSVFSYRESGDSYTIVRRQLLWAVVGVAGAFVASRLSVRWIRGLAHWAFLVSLALLLATAIFGVEYNGNRNWLDLGPVIIQASEIAKLSLVVWAAHVYARKERRLGRLHELVVPVLPGMALAIVLVALGDDLGTAAVLGVILFGMLWVVGAPKRLFASAVLVVGVPGAIMALTDPIRMDRILTFVDPFSDFEKTGWQPAHGLFALSSGGLLGEGIGASQQKWGSLPEAHTDYIFAVLGEELGLVGTLTVIGLFLALSWAALRLARRTTDPFVRYATFGVVVWLMGQMMINVAMVLSLAPVIGVPLPLVSYGGSSLLPTLAALGLLVGFARREPEAARALERRRRGRRP